MQLSKKVYKNENKRVLKKYPKKKNIRRNEMKKLDLEKYKKIVTEIREAWIFQNDYNLISYAIYDSYLYVYSRVTKKGALYLFHSEEEKETIKKRIENIKQKMKKSYVNVRNFHEIKKQSTAMHTNQCGDREIKKGVFRKDTFFKGFFIGCFTPNERREINEYYNVFLSGYVLKSKWAYDFDKYRALITLANQWHRDDLLLMDNGVGEIVDKLEAISRIKQGADIEIEYMNNSGLVCFSYWYWVDGDVFSVDDFVYSDDLEDLISIDEAVWCEDVHDYRHVDDVFKDFVGNIYGSDDELIYSEEKNYYIYESDAVKVYTDDYCNYFWSHCDDLEDYFYHEDDEEYYTYESNNIIRGYQKTRLSPIDSGDKPYFIGVELEMENDTTDKEERGDDILAVLNSEKGKEYYNNILDWKEDSSLDEGVEMVTAPISLAIFKKEIVPIIQNLQKKGYTSEKGGRCGNHIHISRAAFSEEAQSRLVLIYARFENIIKILSRRNGSFSYCKDVLNTFSAISVDNAAEVVQNQKAKSKSTAINFSNTNTIEFRVFRGTMNTNKLIANIQLVQLLADWSRKPLTVYDILNLNITDFKNEILTNDYAELLNYCIEKEVI